MWQSNGQILGLSIFFVVVCMGLFSWLRKNADDPDKLADLELSPDRTAIYDHLSARLDEKTGTLPDTYELPDESEGENSRAVRWAPGAMDGVATHHMGPDGEANGHGKILSAVKRTIRRLSPDEVRELHDLACSEEIVSYIDDLLEAISADRTIKRESLRHLARWLLTRSPDRGPVKLGIALLGICGRPEDAELLSVLGVHDEFTLFSVVALSNLSDNPAEHLWSLARKVEGWGRIHAVERLAGYASSDPRIKDWLLREGYRNSVMYEYLAYICATAGELDTALEGESVDDDLLKSSGELIRALITGGPAQDIDDFEDASRVIERYLYHLAPRADQLDELLVVVSVRNYLVDERSEENLNPETRSLLLNKCESLIERPLWRELLRKDLYTEDESRFWVVVAAARALEVDISARHWERLQAMPLASDRWYQVMDGCTEQQIDDVLIFAERSLPLAEIASGPADELGMGPEWNAHSCLDYILQALERFPGRGWSLVQVGLRSPVVRNRNMALRALAKWDRSTWTSEISEALESAQKAEPDSEVRERIQRVRDGQPFDDADE